MGKPAERGDGRAPGRGGGAAALPARPRLRGVSHQVAFFASLPTGLVLVLRAPGAAARTAVAVYALSLTALLGVSALYHRRDWRERARAVLRRVDHTMIFLLIAGTYTAVAGLALPPGQAWWLLAVVWAGALVGIVLRLLWLTAPRPAVAAPYLALGWVALAALPQLYAALGVGAFALLLAGGVLYSLGALVYALRRPDPLPRTFGYHEVYHAFVLAAAVCHLSIVATLAAPGT